MDVLLDEELSYSGDNPIAPSELSAMEMGEALDNTETDDGWPECDSMVVLMALNEAYIELVSQMITKVERSIENNLLKQRNILTKQQALRESELTTRKKVPVLQYLPPYFKDHNMMCPPLSEEAKLKMKNVAFDPLSKEEKKWSANELKLLRSAVKESMLTNKIQPLKDRRDLFAQKITESGQETGLSEKQFWKDEVEMLDRKIAYERSLSDEEVLVGDYSNVDWVKIANRDFNGIRTPASVRLKWVNEQCPAYNSGPWDKKELEKLKELRENNFVSWGVVADMLGTKRTPWMCFEKYRSDLYVSSREWTQEEDEKLIALVNIMKVNGKIQWDKVTYNMRGRHRQQVRTRYLRTLDKTVKHGRWTDPEDLLLMCAVSKYGAKDWHKIAKSVPGRTDVQCRDRWITGLDKRNACKEWTLEDDEKLLYSVSVFGRGHWVKCSQILKNRLPDQCRYRFQTLLSTKIRLLSSKMSEACSKSLSARLSSTRLYTKNYELNRKYRRFNEMVNGDDETGDKLIAVIDQKTGPKARPRPLRKYEDGFSEQELKELHKNLDEISEKYRRGDVPDITKIVESIPLTDEDVFSMMKQSRLSSHFRRAQSVFVKSRKASMRKIRKTQYLLADNVPIETTFDDNVSEDERVIRLTEALCQAVRKYDQHQWNIDFHKNFSDSSKSTCEDFVEANLPVAKASSLEAYRSRSPIPVDCTYPPTFFSSSTWFTLNTVVRPSLTRSASNIFRSCDAEIDPEDPGKVVPITGKISPNDRLVIELSKEVTESEQYLSFKALIRTIFLEPAQFSMAIDSPSDDDKDE
ncbi:unnamed protein product [Auanema sp. JU1783]|nr:unnamed protein product [Auanema sp. JU1783]